MLSVHTKWAYAWSRRERLSVSRSLYLSFQVSWAWISCVLLMLYVFCVCVRVRVCVCVRVFMCCAISVSEQCSMAQLISQLNCARLDDWTDVPPESSISHCSLDFLLVVVVSVNNKKNVQRAHHLCFSLYTLISERQPLSIKLNFKPKCRKASVYLPRMSTNRRSSRRWLLFWRSKHPTFFSSEIMFLLTLFVIQLN